MQFSNQTRAILPFFQKAENIRPLAIHRILVRRQAELSIERGIESRQKTGPRWAADGIRREGVHVEIAHQIERGELAADPSNADLLRALLDM